ncbi:MAG TPA: GNAT family N-acetyltransferase [Acidimicrobiales bacterium]|nr:GNAT family N-acetyltransferase [Acidimicrobiales bacterium]
MSADPHSSGVRHRRLGAIEVRALRPEEMAGAAGAAARALEDDPASVACYGDDPLVRLDATHGLFVELFDRAVVPQYGAVLGRLVLGVAGMLLPGTCVGAVMGPYVGATLSAPVPPVGDPSRPMVLWATWAAHDLPEEHWHIGPVGVEPAYQGTGIGKAVMGELCRYLDDGGHVGWLETNKERNVRFYSGLGFELVDEASALGVPSWFMRRDPRGG